MRDHTQLLLVLIAAVATACGPSDDGGSPPRQAVAPPTTDAGPADAARPGAAGDLRLVTIEIGRSVNPDQTMRDATYLFVPSDEVWVSVIAESSAARATLQARWLTEGGDVLGDSSQEITRAGRTVASFHLGARPGGWPLGRYTFELSFDGVAIGTTPFEVRQPPL